MKSRILWLVVVFSAMAGFYYTTIKPAMTPTSPRINRRMLKEFQMPEVALPQVPAPSVTVPDLQLPPIRLQPMVISGRRPGADESAPEVPIQNGATIDFSVGAPVVRSQPEDQAAMAKALREMEEAVEKVTFPPTRPAEKK